MNVPPVTMEDLAAFHRQHFGKHNAVNEQPKPAVQVGEDDLGCYADGVKRTLTDDQIRMFRHTEVQNLLRERRRRREAQELGEFSEDGEFADGDPAEGTEEGSEAMDESSPEPEFHQTQREHGRPDEGITQTDGTAQHKTPHRIARELDEIKHEDVKLDY